MPDHSIRSIANTVSLPRVLFWSVLLVIFEGVAFALLTRLQQGRLFVFALVWDAPPSEIEIMEAASSADTFWLPAFAVIAIIWGLLAIGASGSSAVQSTPPKEVAQHRWLLRLAFAVFLVGTLADIVTTFAFFHRDGVDHELHPGIRLVSYALGRSIGPIVTKSFQFAGVLLIAWRWPKFATYLLAITGAIYLAGAIYNVWVSIT